VIVAIESHQGAIDMQVTAIGLDIAENVFQVHGMDAAEKVVVRKRPARNVGLCSQHRTYREGDEFDPVSHMGGFDRLCAR